MKEQIQKHKKILFLALGGLLLLWLQYQLWFDETGIFANTALSHQIEVRREANAVLEARNQVLTEEIVNFKSGTDSIEAKARKELGMIKQGETFFIVLDDEQKR